MRTKKTTPVTETTTPKKVYNLIIVDESGNNLSADAEGAPRDGTASYPYLFRQ